MNAAPQYGFVNEDMSVSEIKASANLRNEAKELQINNQIEINVEDMTKPLNENANPDQTVGKPLTISGNGASALGIPTALEGDDNKDDNKKEDVSDKAPDANDKPAESSDDKKEEGDDEKCPKCGKNPCKCDDKKEDDGKKEKKSVSEEEDKDDAIVNKEIMRLNQKLLNKKRQKVNKMYSGYDDEEHDVDFDKRIKNNKDKEEEDDEEEFEIERKIRKLEGMKAHKKEKDERMKKEKDLTKGKRLVGGLNKLSKVNIR